MAPQTGDNNRPVERAREDMSALSHYRALARIAAGLRLALEHRPARTNMAVDYCHKTARTAVGRHSARTRTAIDYCRARARTAASGTRPRGRRLKTARIAAGLR
jgi:hypothetical protein